MLKQSYMFQNLRILEAFLLRRVSLIMASKQQQISQLL